MTSSWNEVRGVIHKLIVVVGIILIGCSLASCRLFKAEESPRDALPPNIVVIFCDDLGYGDLSVTGSRFIATPHLSQMAAEGAFFRNFYASANVCTPSRFGLLTGRYPIRADLARGVLFPNSKTGIPEEEITIAEALKPLGYQTACIGKWHLGHLEPYWPTNNGFDYYYGLPYSNDMRPLALYRMSENIEEPVDQSTLTERYTEEAVRFIEKNADKPFFIYLPHTMPHIPLYASEKFRGKSKGSLYGDVIETIDWGVGEILSTLKRLKIDRNTLVIFTSDNGPWYEGSSGPFRDRKGEAWEGGHHVPFIARWPGKIKKKSICDVPTTALDLLPTIVNLAGGSPPQERELDGRDISALLLGDKEGRPEDLDTRPIYMFNNNDIAAIRSGDWKMVARGRYITHNVRFDVHRFYNPGLLFNLKEDPGETINRADEHPEIMQQMIEWAEIGKTNLVPDKNKGS